MVRRWKQREYAARNNRKIRDAARHFREVGRAQRTGQNKPPLHRICIEKRSESSCKELPRICGLTKWRRTPPDDTILAMGLVGSTRIEVSADRSDLGRWRSAQRPAEPRLRDYVLGYFASEGFLPRPLHERHLPPREVAIVLNFAAPHRIIDPSDPKRTTEHRNAWIVALQHRHQIREAFGARDFMVIRLTPIGAQMLLGTPMDLLTDRTLALEDVDSRFSRLLTAHAEAAHDWATRFDIVENMIAARLASAPVPPAGLLHSWRILQESPNQVDLARLPEDFGCSRRYLIAQFHKYFGMTPKMIARISRFHLALAAVHRLGRRDPLPRTEGKPYLDCQADESVHTATQATIRWTDLALDCGYYDQSHFINEFRSFSGLSPLEFLRRTRHE
jgi:AraC-like DNA-binding protein